MIVIMTQFLSIITSSILELQYFVFVKIFCDK